MGQVFLDHVYDSVDGFGFSVASDSPNDIMAERIFKYLKEGKKFRMAISEIYDLE